MSEIRYIPPASTPTPGTTINPTNLFLPYRSNATTFLDSSLKQTSATQLQTIFSGLANGFNLIDSAQLYIFGRLNGGQLTNLQILDSVGQFQTFHNGSNKGLTLDCTLNQYYFGNYLFGNRLNLEVNASSSIIRTNINGVTTGLQMLFGSRNFQFGDFTTQNTRLVIADVGREMYSTCNGNTNGFYFSLGTGARFYQFGQITGSNRNQFVVDDVNQTIYTSRNGSKTGIAIDTNLSLIGTLTLGNQLALGTNDSAATFIFNGTGITTATAGGSAGLHLKVRINSVDYKIALLNP